MERICGNCRFKGNGCGQDVQCRRYAPTAIKDPQCPRALWPEVNRFRDFCGEWEPERGAEEQFASMLETLLAQDGAPEAG